MDILVVLAGNEHEDDLPPAMKEEDCLVAEIAFQ